MTQLPNNPNEPDEAEKKITSSNPSNKLRESLLIQLIKQVIPSHIRNPSWKSVVLIIVLSILATIFQQLQGGEDNQPDKKERDNQQYKEISISIQVACEHPLFVGEEFRGLKVEAFEEKRNNVWPVFRWKCKYIDDSGVEFTKGLDLDKYCLELTQEEHYKAYPKNYSDKNSWYCTYVGPKF